MKCYKRIIPLILACMMLAGCGQNVYKKGVESLENNDYAAAFGPSFIQGAVTYDKNGGQRPRKVWSEVISVPALTWNVSTVKI